MMSMRLKHLSLRSTICWRHCYVLPLHHNALCVRKHEQVQIVPTPSYVAQTIVLKLIKGRSILRALSSPASAHECPFEML